MTTIKQHEWPTSRHKVEVGDPMGAYSSSVPEENDVRGLDARQGLGQLRSLAGEDDVVVDDDEGDQDEDGDTGLGIFLKVSLGKMALKVLDFEGLLGWCFLEL
ncbi:hypothetical protein ACLOJK_031405 [Asimina triloba]